VAVVMIWFGMPSDGVSHWFFKGPWIVGQIYAMTAMIIFLFGRSNKSLNWREFRSE